MKRKKINTLIISDIHLGTEVSRADRVMEIINRYKFKKLILLGDIFDDLDFENMPDHHWNLISLFRRVSQKAEVVWVEGNHDKGLSKVMAAMFGIQVYKTYTWNYHYKKCLAIHGHQFDRFLINEPVLSFLASQIYLFIQKHDFKDFRMSRWIKKKSKGWLRISKKVARSAILYGRVRGADNVFCGHTHRAIHLKRKGINYYNSGCWTQLPSSYITLSHGVIKIHRVK
jgi:UDP-2,3-diacylglucosamine pyrophosphatase LpxH